MGGLTRAEILTAYAGQPHELSADMVSKLLAMIDDGHASDTGFGVSMHGSRGGGSPRVIYNAVGDKRGKELLRVCGATGVLHIENVTWETGVKGDFYQHWQLYQAVVMRAVVNDPTSITIDNARELGYIIGLLPERRASFVGSIDSGNMLSEERVLKSIRTAFSEYVHGDYQGRREADRVAWESGWDLANS